MRILKVLFSILLILFGIYLAGGFLIPAKWMVSRSITINASADQIYPYLANFKEWENWSAWNSKKDPTLQYSYEGPEVGTGSKQSWKGDKMGKGWMQFTFANPEKGVSYDLYIDMGSSQSTLNGVISFSQEGDDTKVTWIDYGDSGESSINRWLSLLIKPMLGKDIDVGLTNLKALVEKK